MEKQVQNKQIFDPLIVMGVFWLSFGVIVLISTFFIKEIPLVPTVASIVVNLCAGAALCIAGVICLLKSRANKNHAK